MILDHRTVDAAGVFLESRLENIDPTLNLPLDCVTYPDDIKLRSGVVIDDEMLSFARTEFGFAGGGRKSWSALNATSIPGVDVSDRKEVTFLHGWSLSASWGVQELSKSQRLGRPIDVTKIEAIKEKHQKDIDELVYVGDEDIKACGLLNNPNIPPFAFQYDWSTASREEILQDVDKAVEYAWRRANKTRAPQRMLVPHKQLSALLRPIPGTDVSAYDYVSKNCVAAKINKKPLEIDMCRYADGVGAGGTNRTVFYTNDQRFLRLPISALHRSPPEQRGLAMIVIFYGLLAPIEWVYPETITYADGR